VGLLEAREHVGHDGAGAAVVAAASTLGRSFVVDGLPIEAAQLGVPVFVADGLPDHFEGIDVQLALGRVRAGWREKARRPPAAGPGPRVETASSTIA